MKRLSIVCGLVLALMVSVAAASCGGGDDTSTSATTPPPPTDQELGNYFYPSNETPPLNPGGIPAYNGAVPIVPPTTPPAIPPPAPAGGYGANIYPMPVDSQGNGTVSVHGFEAGQQVALVTLNIAGEYLDYHTPANGLPRLPETTFSIMFDLVNRGTSALGSSSVVDLSKPSPFTETLLSPEGYKGLSYDPVRPGPDALVERGHEDWVAQGGFDTRAPNKVASAISKGEVRTFTEIPATTPPPPVQPTQENQDTSNLRWPDPYYGQDGRLVATGAKCYIFLTTEINMGYADQIRFTEERLIRLAHTFDTVIYPRITETMAPVRGTMNKGPGENSGPIWRDIDRTVTLTADDFDNDGNLITPLPGRPDLDIGKDGRIVIAIMNLDTMGAAGLYANWQRGIYRPQDEEGGAQQKESYAWSTVYLDAGIFPENDDEWSQPYAVLSHEFQHKIYADNGGLDSVWLNEGLAQLAVYVAGYTMASGHTAQILVNQIDSYLHSVSMTPVPLDGEQIDDVDIFAEYGARFLFFLYIAEHYGPGTVRKFYTTSAGSPVALIEAVTGERFETVFTKWSLANLVDGIYVSPDSPLAETTNPWLHYLTFDIRGHIAGNETDRLPGVPIMRLPAEGETFPVSRPAIRLNPWCQHYAVIENGDGRDLDLTILADPSFRIYLLPIDFNEQTNLTTVAPGVFIPNA